MQLAGVWGEKGPGRPGCGRIMAKEAAREKRTSPCEMRTPALRAQRQESGGGQEGASHRPQVSVEVALEAGAGPRNSLTRPGGERGVCHGRREARSPRSGRWPGADVGLGRREEGHGVIPRRREYDGGQWPCRLPSHRENAAGGTARDRDRRRPHVPPGHLRTPALPPRGQRSLKETKRALGSFFKPLGVSPLRLRVPQVGTCSGDQDHSARRTTSACRGEFSAVCPSWQTGCQPCPAALLGRGRHRPREHVPVAKVSSAKPRRPLPARAAVSSIQRKGGPGGWTLSRQLHFGGGSV